MDWSLGMENWKTEGLCENNSRTFDGAGEHAR